MEHHSDIDDLLRRRLYDAEVKPPEFVWPNVEQALRKKKRRAFFWWFMGPACAAGIAFGAWYWSAGQTAGALAENTASTSVSPPVASEKQGAASVGYAVDNGKPDPRFPAENAEKSALPTTIRPNAALMNVGGAKLAPVGENRLPAASAKQNESFSFEKSGLQNTENTAAEEIQSNTKSSPEQGEPTPDFIPKGPNVASINNLQVLPLSFRPTSYDPAPAKPGTIPYRIIRRKKESRACYDFSKHPNAWLFDAYIGPSFAFKELSTNNPEYQHYLERRRETERRDWAFNAGVRGTLVFDQHFMLRLGLHYDQMTEVFELIDPNSIIVDVQYVTTYVNGVPVVVADTLGVRYGDKYFKSYNRFGMLDIPVQAGVEIRKGRSGFNINAGFSLNVWFWKQGAYLTTNGTARYFTPGGANTTEIFRARTGISAVGSVQWFYHLQPKLRVFAEPYFRQIVQPVNLKSHPVGQRYGVGGIRFGVTKILD